MHAVRSTISTLRDRWAPVSHTSTFLQTGEITPEEFVLAGDYLVYKFPSWSWASAASSSQQVSYLPPQKQYLVTRNVPCRRALDDNFAGQEGLLDALELDGEGMEGQGDEEGWLRTGTDGVKAVKTIRESESADQIMVDDDDEDDDIPDIDDEEDDDAIIRDPGASSKTPLRTYNLYITYSTYYRTPRLYLQGYKGANQPLPPQQMLDDIIGDYKDKTVTLEDFPFFPTVMSIKMASVHPCKHASVMKVLLDRANNALKIRTAKLRAGQISKENAEKGLEGLVDSTRGLSLGSNVQQGFEKGVVAAGGGNGDEWEVLQEDVPEESAIRVDQYLVVFLKFMASVMPGLDDLTMGI